jgi:hypothetical protein
MMDDVLRGAGIAAPSQSSLSSYPAKWPYDVTETYFDHVGEFNAAIRTALQIGSSLIVRCSTGEYDKIDRLLRVMLLLNQAWELLNEDEKHEGERQAHRAELFYIFGILPNLLGTINEPLALAAGFVCLWEMSMGHGN